MSCSACSWTSTAASTPSASTATEPRASSRRPPRPRRLPPRQAVPRHARGRQRSLGRRCRLGEESPSDHAAGSRGQIAQSIYLVSYSGDVYHSCFFHVMFIVPLIFSVDVLIMLVKDECNCDGKGEMDRDILPRCVAWWPRCGSPMLCSDGPPLLDGCRWLSLVQFPVVACIEPGVHLSFSLSLLLLSLALLLLVRPVA
ncbi:hypothetical protein VPH35_072660 [Triticum aestivum]